MKKLLPVLLCIAAPFAATAQITVSTSQYTTEQLVNTVLSTNPLVPATAITSSTGSNFSSENGIGYFQNNNSGFPFESGIILSTGGADNAPGPLTSSNEGSSEWLGDNDLTALMSIISPSVSRNASVLEFDFIALQDHISLEYIFASNEYGTYQCSFGDAVGIFLGDNSINGTPVNIAVIPGTTVPVGVTTIRSNAYNTACPSMNVNFFGEYYAADPTTAPVNFKGATIVMSAEASTIAGHSYHIKIAIADRADTQFDSSIFINAGSFNSGNINTDEIAITSSAGDMLCNGNSTLLTAPGNSLFTYTWSYNGMLVPTTAQTLEAAYPGVYTVTITLAGTDYSASASITLTDGGGIADFVSNSEVIVYEEDTDGIAEFDLSAIQNDLDTQFTGLNYTITFHETAADAELDANAIASLLYTNTSNPQNIYGRIENENGCYVLPIFELSVLEAVMAPTGNPVQTFENGGTLADIEIDGENIQWYDNSGEDPVFPDGSSLPLPLNTPLADGMTYYASQTINGVESAERFGVTVHILLGTNGNTFTSMQHYPNPVKDLLNIENAGSIDNVTITNILAQTVLTKTINNTTAQVDMSSLGDGVYFVKVTSGNTSKTIKIIKE